MTPTEPLYLGILILTGAFAGVISGLLGVGGGFIMSPVQYWLLQETGLESDLAIRIALGTSLFVILPNATSVVLKYQQKRAVLWKQAKIMGMSGLLATFRGAAPASHLPASILSKIFGVVVIIGALRTYTTPTVTEMNEISLNSTSYVFAGILIGFFSGLLGIGGGVIGVPITLIFLHFDMLKAVQDRIDELEVHRDNALKLGMDGPVCKLGEYIELIRDIQLQVQKHKKMRQKQEQSVKKIVLGKISSRSKLVFD